MSDARLNPYLSFDGNAREAMEYYHAVFGGELRLNTFAEFGAADGPGANNIMHSQLEVSDGVVFMAADMPPGQTYQPGQNIAMSLSGGDAEQLRTYWRKLSSAGEVLVPLEKQMWGDEFGMCVDQFSIQWMVNINASS